MTDVIAYVRDEDAPALPPPPEQAGAVGWLYSRAVRPLWDFSTFNNGVRAVWTLFGLASLCVGAWFALIWTGVVQTPALDQTLPLEALNTTVAVGLAVLLALVVLEGLFGLSRLGAPVAFVLSIAAVAALILGWCAAVQLMRAGALSGVWALIVAHLPEQATAWLGETAGPTTVLAGAIPADATLEQFLWGGGDLTEAARGATYFWLALGFGVLCVTTDKSRDWSMTGAFFSSAAFALLTFLIAWSLTLIFSAAYDFMVADAVFTAADGLKGEACRPDSGRGGVLPAGEPIGACWPMVEAKLYQFTYGFYPRDEVWRVNIVYSVLAMGVAYMILEDQRWNAFFGMVAFALYVALTFGLLTNAEQLALPQHHWVVAAASFLVVSALATRSERWLAIFMLTVFPLAALVMLNGTPIMEHSSTGGGADDSARGALMDMIFAPWLTVGDVDFAKWAMGAFGAGLALFSVVAASGRIGDAARVFSAPVGVLALILLGLFAVPLAMGAMDYGLDLDVVETSKWGGLLVTLVVALAGIVASLPLGVLLALGRRSRLPVVRFLSIIFIEFWRGVPLITVLFMASNMLPYFLPEGVEFNKLMRALIGVALFASAYMAEVVRGGLQAIPSGQYEGAMSLGLGYGRQMRLIILPQALTLVIPGIVNTFIGLFKDTTLVLIIGMFDLLGIQQATTSDPEWSAPTTAFTGYVFVAAVFWVFCFGMSRYSLHMERKLYRGHKR